MNLVCLGASVSAAGHTTPRSGGYLHPMLRLYRALFSTNVERVALALAYKALEAESVVITYENRSPVIELSGQGLVPVLVDGEEVVARDAKRMRASLDLFETMLDGRDHLFGDDFSAADCAAFPFLKYGKLPTRRTTSSSTASSRTTCVSTAATRASRHGSIA
jgi:glutathione S-transferase